MNAFHDMGAYVCEDCAESPEFFGDTGKRCIYCGGMLRQYRKSKKWFCTKCGRVIDDKPTGVV